MKIYITGYRAVGKHAITQSVVCTNSYICHTSSLHRNKIKICTNQQYKSCKNKRCTLREGIVKSIEPGAGIVYSHVILLLVIEISYSSISSPYVMFGVVHVTAMLVVYCAKVILVTFTVSITPGAALFFKNQFVILMQILIFINKNNNNTGSNE